MSNDSVLDERTLREIYLPSFEMAVKEGGVKCLMTSYNKVNGTYAHEHMHLLRDILYGDWDYDGMVVSDWGGNNDRVESIKAGGTLEMPSSNGQTDRQLVKAVQNGTLDEAVLDEQVNRILDMIFSTQPAIQGSSYNKDEHHQIAARVAEKTAVLLKNEDNLLPLKPDASVAVIGDFAETPRYQGAGSSKINPTKLDCGLDALKAIGVNVIGFAPGFRRNGKTDGKLIREACALAQQADTVLLWLGLDEGGEAEGVDRENMLLPANQIALLQAIAQVNSNIAVVLSCGCAVEMEWDVHAKAVIHGYLGGQAGALAMAKLLTGAVSPSGKLSETVPLSDTDVSSAPYYPGREATTEYREGLYVGYRYFDTIGQPVKYPFGHGLSYTEFAYSNLTVSETEASFVVRNIGSVHGEEVAQLYISAKTDGMFRPAQELKGFSRISLAPNEEQTVTIPLSNRSFAVWSILENDWVIESGTYELRIGASSRDIRLTAEIKKEGPPVENPYKGDVFAPYYSGAVHTVSDESFAALLGRAIPDTKWDPDAPIGFNDPIARCEQLSGGFGKFLFNLLRLIRSGLWAMGKRETSNSVLFVTNLPWRGVARMSGILTDEQVYALLDVVNRKKGGWRKFIKCSLLGKSE